MYDQALITACEKGHDYLIRPLLTGGANINAYDALSKRGALLASIENSQVTCIMVLIQLGADLNQAGHNGRTALIEAVGKFGDDVSTLRLLIESGADVNKADDKNSTPLDYACLYGYANAAKLLLHLGATLYTNDERRARPLIFASMNGHESIVNLIIEYTNHKNITLLDGGDALIKASSRGHINIVKTIANFVKSNSDKGRALLESSTNGHIETVKFLVEAGARVNFSNYDWEAPITKAAINGHAETIRVLAKAGANVNAKNRNMDTALVIASREGYMECVNTLLEVGADVNIKTWNRDTALVIAAKKRDSECVNKLLQVGANANIKVLNGDTALGIAGRNGDFKSVDALLNSGANVNQPDKYGWPVLMSAASEGHIRCVEYIMNVLKAGHFAQIPLRIPLGNHMERIQFFKAKESWILKHKVDVSYVFTHYERRWDETPAECFKDCVRILLKFGADMNKATSNGWTPLMVASLDGNKDIMKLLIESGADVNTVSENGWTPLITAVVGNQLDCAKSLIEAGADVNIQVSFGCVALNRKKNALGFAVDIGNVEMVKCLLQSAIQLFPLQMANPHNSEISHLLIAAGYSNSRRKLVFRRAERDEQSLRVKPGLDLSAQCRAVIRRRLFETRPLASRLYKVHSLGLPFPLQKYLLFGVSLD